MFKKYWWRGKSGVMVRSSSDPFIASPPNRNVAVILRSSEKGAS